MILSGPFLDFVIIELKSKNRKTNANKSKENIPNIIPNVKQHSIFDVFLLLHLSP